MNELALFAGAGGGILGGKLLGWRTVCAVEINDYARKVLLARQDDGYLEPFPIWDDVRTFDGKPWRGLVDVVSGGFPCQDLSASSPTRTGLDGDRSGLWWEMARIIGEVRPPYVLVENSPTLTARGLGRILGKLAQMGYNAKWGVLGACCVGGTQRRKRMWILATTFSFRLPKPGKPLRKRAMESFAYPAQAWPPGPSAISTIPRMADELANRVDRLTAIGNGQVAAVVPLIWSLLAPEGQARDRGC